MSYIVVAMPNNQYKVYKAEDHPRAIAGGFLTKEAAIAYAVAAGRTAAE